MPFATNILKNVWTHCSHPVLVSACWTVTAGSTVFAQSSVPVVTLPSASRTATQKSGLIFGVRELANGSLLVNDAGNRLLKLFDASLTSAVVVLDSADGALNKYGARPAPLIPYLGDSTLVPVFGSLAMLVIDGSGRIIRSMALPTPADVRFMRPGAGIDNAGRIVYAGEAPTIKAIDASGVDHKGDSVPLLRADLDLRRTDTIGTLARPLLQTRATSPDGRAIVGIWTVDPLRTVDEWAILTDGSIAIVRGHDYRIDFIRPNDARTSTDKLPFDWKSLSTDDKHRIADSVRAQLEGAMTNGTLASRAEMITVTRKPALPSADAAPRPTAAPARTGPGFQGFTLLPDSVDRFDKIADYYPPVRPGGALADLDGNVWILPTTSKQSQQGELVYDVVSSRGVLVRRVRVPPGRLIVGFGKRGVVYMTSGSIANGFGLERSQLP